MSILYFINSNNKNIKSFYEKLGIVWQKSKDGFFLFYGINNFYLILNEESTEFNSRKLFFIKDNNLLIEYHPKSINYCSNSSILDIYKEVKNQYLESSSKEIIPILRSHNIQKTAELYSILGRWELEKHNTGPEHYSLSFQNSIVEIYPVRKSSPIENIELAWQGYSKDISLQGLVTDPDGINLILL